MKRQHPTPKSCTAERMVMAACVALAGRCSSSAFVSHTIAAGHHHHPLRPLALRITPPGSSRCHQICYAVRYGMVYTALQLPYNSVKQATDYPWRCRLPASMILRKVHECYFSEDAESCVVERIWSRSFTKGFCITVYR